MLRVLPYISCSASGKGKIQTSSSSPQGSPVVTRKAQVVNLDYEQVLRENRIQATRIAELEELVGTMNYANVAVTMLSTCVLGAMMVSGVGMS